MIRYDHTQSFVLEAEIYFHFLDYEYHWHVLSSDSWHYLKLSGIYGIHFELFKFKQLIKIVINYESVQNLKTYRDFHSKIYLVV